MPISQFVTFTFDSQSRCTVAVRIRPCRCYNARNLQPENGNIGTNTRLDAAVMYRETPAIFCCPIAIVKRFFWSGRPTRREGHQLCFHTVDLCTMLGPFEGPRLRLGDMLEELGRSWELSAASSRAEVRSTVALGLTTGRDRSSSGLKAFASRSSKSCPGFAVSYSQLLMNQKKPDATRAPSNGPIQYIQCSVGKLLLATQGPKLRAGLREPPV